MLPSSTVENYLKALFLTQSPLPPSELVPMGQLAMALGVAPGTATTMVKALAEAGLVQYEPYTGVRLLPAGEKLAALVLRRHRLVELFLVQVMGMSWAEVHEEAELLEHVVSERLIERMDDMLGRPQVDPHGDPIPDPAGTIRQQEFQNLLTCPLSTPVAVSRVADQNPAFLRFLEESHLKPGQRIEVEARDAASDSVRVRGKDGERLTIGMRAASKLLVRVLQVFVMTVAATAGVFIATPVRAQTSAASPPPGFEILDNSFLVEEAFNQERGIFQNIVSVRSDQDEWETTFTQEWPLGGVRHQLSYTLPFAGSAESRGLGDVLINYRYQVLDESGDRPAFSPRLSIILPSGNEHEGRGSGHVGWQVNLPFSKQVRDLYVHWNAGFTYLRQNTPASSGGASGLTTPHLAASAIWRVRPMINVMFESVAEFEESLALPRRTTRQTRLTLSPGARVGRNIGDRQLVLGIAAPFETNLAQDRSTWSILGYVSYELPFRH